MTDIIIRYSSDDLVVFSEEWEGLDRDATVREYEASLARDLESRYGGPVQVIDTPQMGLGATSIELIPCPDDPRELEAQIQADMEFHYARANFWVEKVGE